MSFIKATGEKKLMLFAGRAHPDLADAVARELGIELTPQAAYDFANGEIFVRYQESVRGCDAFVLQSHATPLNKWIMEQFIMVDALKRASAKRITVVTPFYGYARQDKKPWIWAVCRSTAINRLAPEVLNRSATSLAEIGSRPRCFLS